MNGWDVIVIGTGIGGATAGRALAEEGLRVLFLEQGRAGHRAEETPLDLDMGDPVARAVRGFWPDPVRARIGGQALELFAPLGAGPGGSSVFYAATLERPGAADLATWPGGAAALDPYLDRAEAMYHVAPAPLSRGDTVMLDRLKANGIDARPLTSAVRHLPGCAECLGRKCPRPCKMDARSAGLEPALATGRAELWTGARVVQIAGDDRVRHIVVERDGQRDRLEARAFVLAGGALGSAQLLLTSRSERWPEGFANGSGLVGRGLMFHLNEMMAVWPGRRAGYDAPSKAVGFRDLCHVDGQPLGMVQAMGLSAGYGEILHALRQAIARSALRRVPGAHALARLPAALAERALGSAQIFVGLLEDLPYDNNRVLPEAGRLAFTYDFAPELLTRRQRFRAAMRAAFRGMPRAFLTRLPEPNLGHPCGTLRMGTDPGTSVVAPNGRAHGAVNLWVADAGVFPTSTGLNPSLTIAAHALRMAEAVTKELAP